MATTTIRVDRNFTILCLCVSSEEIFLNVKSVHIASSLYRLSTNLMVTVRLRIIKPAIIDKKKSHLTWFEKFTKEIPHNSD